MARSIAPRDFQRQRLYDWEGGEIHPTELGVSRTPSQLYIYLDRLWDEFEREVDGIVRPHPTLKVSNRLRASSYYNAEQGMIVLANKPWALTYHVLIHEAAHAMLSAVGQDILIPWHGKEFTGVVLDLYGRALEDPELLVNPLTDAREALYESAHARGLQFLTHEGGAFGLINSLVEEWGSDVWMLALHNRYGRGSYRDVTRHLFGRKLGHLPIHKV